MALVVVNRNAPQAHDVIRLRDNLRLGREAAQYINDVATNATDSDLATVLGIQSVDATAFKSVVANLVTALDAPAVDNYINNLG